MILAALNFAEIDALIGDGLGRFDVACPLCAFDNHTPANSKRKVLRIWREQPDFATFCCQRCGAEGWARDDAQRVRVDKPRHQAMAQKAFEDAAQRQRKALSLWHRRRPIVGKVAERYLRQTRGYRGPLPATLGFLPARGNCPPGLVGAFGLPDETAPGKMRIEENAITGIHITRLTDDARKVDENAKIFLGSSSGSPLVLAPFNDLLGLAITEGIEDALTAHQATGLGAWAAGSAGRMAKLAPVVPEYVEAVTIYAHQDAAGQRGAHDLAEALVARGFEVFIDGMTP